MIRVQRDDFDVGREIALLHEGNTAVGGICAFVGLVRDFADDETVTTMTLEHYPAMTEKALEDIEAEARKRWPLDGTVIVHRYGRLSAGDRIVFVGAASAHREAAFEACHFLIDWLKTKAPFWKLEEGTQTRRWVAAKADDDTAAQKWEKPKS